jgi:thiol-disulfide isomerase/thioredoxin
MKPSLLLAIVITIVSGMPVSARSADAPFGLAIHAEPRPLPPVRFETVGGLQVDLSDFRGQTVLLNIWATWCPPCRKEMPSLDRLQSKLGERGIQIIALSIDRAGMSAVERFFRETGIQHLTPYLDNSGNTSRVLGVSALPTTLLIDSAGREIGRLIGPAQWDAPEMSAFLDRYNSELRK